MTPLQYTLDVHCSDSFPSSNSSDQNPETADPVQGEDVGEQAWEGVVGVPHRRHEEGHHSTGEDNGNNDAIEDNYVEYGDSNGGDQ